MELSDLLNLDAQKLFSNSEDDNMDKFYHSCNSSSYMELSNTFDLVICLALILLFMTPCSPDSDALLMQKLAAKEIGSKRKNA